MQWNQSNVDNFNLRFYYIRAIIVEVEYGLITCKTISLFYHYVRLPKELLFIPN